MDDVVAQRFNIAHTQRPRTRSLNPTAAIRQAAPKDIVLAAGINTYYGPHAMIMRRDSHHRSPNHIEDGEIARVKKSLDFGPFRLAQTFQDSGRFRNNARNGLAHQLVRGV